MLESSRTWYKLGFVLSIAILFVELSMIIPVYYFISKMTIALASLTSLLKEGYTPFEKAQILLTLISIGLQEQIMTVIWLQALANTLLALAVYAEKNEKELW